MAWRHLANPTRAQGSLVILKKAGRRQLAGGLGLRRKGGRCCLCRASIPTIQAFLIAIFFSLFCACSVFGSVTVSTPFLKFASILSASTPSGTPNERWNEP